MPSETFLEFKGDEEISKLLFESPPQFAPHTKTTINSHIPKETS